MQPSACRTSCLLLPLLALLSVMVLAAAQLVIHSIQLLGATGRSVRNPILVHVTNRLRNDVQEAAGVVSVEDVWTEDPLVLTTRAGGVPFPLLGDDSVSRRFLREAEEEQVVSWGGIHEVLMKQMNCYVRVNGTDNPFDTADVGWQVFLTVAHQIDRIGQQVDSHVGPLLGPAPGPDNHSSIRLGGVHALLNGPVDL